MDESREGKDVGVGDGVKDEAGFMEAMVVGVEREELGGEISMVG